MVWSNTRRRSGAARLAPFLVLLYVLAPMALAQGDDRAELRAFLERTVQSSESFDDRFDAEVWLVDMSGRLAPLVDDAEERLELLRMIHGAATRADLPPELVLAVIEVESHFDRFAVSRVGAQGLMQVMPFWKNEIGRPDDNLTDNRTNLEYGCRILQFYLTREDGALHRALAAYNGSSGSRVYSDKVKDRWTRRWRTDPLTGAASGAPARLTARGRLNTLPRSRRRSGDP